MTEDELRAACLEFAEHYDSLDDLIAFAKRMQNVGLREAAQWAKGEMPAAHLPHDRWDIGYRQALANCFVACLEKAKEREGQVKIEPVKKDITPSGNQLLYQAAFNSINGPPWFRYRIVGPYRIVIRHDNQILKEWKMNDDTHSRELLIDKPVVAKIATMYSLEYWRD